MKTFEVDVIQTVRVTLDETKFTPEFLNEFANSFYPFLDIEDHAEHIAQLRARGIIEIDHVGEFIEGYGPSDEFGMKTEITETDTYLSGYFA